MNLQQWLFSETMKRLDRSYDPDAHMLSRSFGRREFHDLRGSCHYVLGLLVRDEPGDRSRALEILDRILDAQFLSDPSMAYYGGFPRDDREKEPPAEPFPGEHFDAVSRYYLEKWQESIRGKFYRNMAEEGYSGEQIRQIEGICRRSVLETLPVVWGNWDANWREFVATELAMILVHAEDRLDAGRILRIETAAEKAVSGSIRRYEDHVVPMNTNVELMHVFICGFFGERSKEKAFLDHALKASVEIYGRYMETESFAEYNSTTYNSVDLVALSMWRQFLKTKELRETGEALEAGLWRNIAQMYHPGLDQVCGPNARNYDNDMYQHSMIPAMMYIAMEGRPQPMFNVETAGYIEIALNGTRIPEDVVPELSAFSGPRRVKKQFRELMERGCPGDDTTLCTVTATLEEHWMMGAMSGSRNTSGQLKSAVAFWRAPDGSLMDLTLQRRMPGGNPGEHLWTVYFDGQVDGGHLRMRVCPDVDRDIEIYFVIHGDNLREDLIEKDSWLLPGMTIRFQTDAGVPRVVKTGEKEMEIIFDRPFGKTPKELSFDLVLEESSGQ